MNHISPRYQCQNGYVSSVGVGLRFAAESLWFKIKLPYWGYIGFTRLSWTVRISLAQSTGTPFLIKCKKKGICKGIKLIVHESPSICGGRKEEEKVRESKEFVKTKEGNKTQVVVKSHLSIPHPLNVGKNNLLKTQWIFLRNILFPLYSSHGMLLLHFIYPIS